MPDWVRSAPVGLYTTCQTYSNLNDTWMTCSCPFILQKKYKLFFKFILKWGALKGVLECANELMHYIIVGLSCKNDTVSLNQYDYKCIRLV